MRSSGGRRRNYKETWNTTHSERLVLGHHSEMVEGILQVLEKTLRLCHPSSRYIKGNNTTKFKEAQICNNIHNYQDSILLMNLHNLIHQCHNLRFCSNPEFQNKIISPKEVIASQINNKCSHLEEDLPVQDWVPFMISKKSARKIKNKNFRMFLSSRWRNKRKERMKKSGRRKRRS